MKPITVLIVDDCIVQRHLLSEMLADIPDIKVLDTAVGAQDAREKIKALDPDVLTLDINMPGMDGLDFLEKIMTLRPMPVIMVSSVTREDAHETIRALELGAVDYINKLSSIKASPDVEGHEVTVGLRQELITKIRAAAGANVHGRQEEQATKKKPSRPAYTSDGTYHNVIAIGSSTGGVETLRYMFTSLPPDCPPILVVQHMPEHFTATFAARLNTLSAVNVSEARNGDMLKAGHAYIAPGNRHMAVARNGHDLFCKTFSAPLVSGHRPSVNVLFDSMADVVGENAIGVILTGMGKDGSVGMLKMRERGAYNIGQSESSCVIYGMPRAASAIGAVHIELPLSGIVEHILQRCTHERKIRHG